MADEPRTPVAIRISRPYTSEDEFLQHELDTLTRTTVVLLGAQSRPQGVVLRFEVALASGDALMRGEGRVVGFRPAAGGVDSGLTLRFTRLDARSKALVDKAAALRDARPKASLHPRASHAPPPLPAMPAAPRAPVIPAPEVRASAPPQRAPAPDPGTQPTLEEPISSTQILPVSSDPLLLDSRPFDSRPQILESRPQVAAPPAPASGTIHKARRDELLERLRQRAKALSPKAVETLLASRTRRA